MTLESEYECLELQRLLKLYRVRMPHFWISEGERTRSGRKKTMEALVGLIELLSSDLIPRSQRRKDSHGGVFSPILRVRELKGVKDCSPKPR